MRTTLIIVLLVFAIFESYCSAQPGISSDGREYYVSLMQPSFWRTVSFDPRGVIIYAPSYNAKLFIMSTSDNDVTVSYIGNGGIETNSTAYHIPAFTSKVVPLVTSSITPAFDGKNPEYKTCHIVAKAPVSVQVTSVAGFSGGAYQPLPLQCLGKKYVVMSYRDNPSGLGAVVETVNNQKSAGFAIITAPYYGTTVQITPSSTTLAGNPGVRCGTGANQKPQPFSIELNKGQSYVVRSASEDANCDLSGTTIESSKPIIVLAGHDNANTDGSDVQGLDVEVDWRDYMIEQLLPVECFDTTGYFTIPFQAAFDGSAVGGSGDEIRAFSDGTSNSSVQFTTGPSSTVDFSCSPYQIPPSTKIGLTLPSSLYTLNGKPFSVMMYDQRSQGKSGAGTAPSMTSIIPRSHWKSEYYWTTFFEGKYSSFSGAATHILKENSFTNIICSKTDYNNGAIKVSINGSPLKKITTAGLTIKRTWSDIPAAPDLMGLTISNLQGSAYIINTAVAQGAEATSPLVVYTYGTGIHEPLGYTDIRASNACYSYSQPLGMVYKAFGVKKPSISATFTDNCNGWNICLKDSGGEGNGIRYIELLNYENNTMVPKPPIANNVAFDPAVDPLGKGEIVLEDMPLQYCFNVIRNRSAGSCRAVIAVYDNSGDRFMIDLSTTAEPMVAANGDLIQAKDMSYEFVPSPIDSEVCGKVVIKNSDLTGIVDLLISQIVLPKDNAFKLTSTLPQLPLSLHKTDSIVLNFCFIPIDTAVRTATLQISTGCSDYYKYTLQGRGIEGLIDATDMVFSDIKVSDEECNSLSISNVGTYPFRLTGYSLDNHNSFSLDISFVATLPIVLQPGSSIEPDVCFHPQEYGDHVGRIDWKTDLSDNTKIKAYSLLSGKSTKPTTGVAEKDITTIFKARSDADRLIIEIPSGASNMKFELFDLLGRLAAQWEYPATNEKTISIGIPNLASGTYILRMQAGTMVKSCAVIIK